MFLKEGSNGPEVVQLQLALNKLGGGLVADGLFGVRTKNAVRAFQETHGLSVDGVVGDKTIAMLLAAVKSADPVVIVPPVDHTDGPLKGTDVYHGDDISSWSKLAANNSFIFMKASDGLKGTDSKFKEYWAEAKSHGLIRGAYHFAQWGAGSGAKQAQHFWETIKDAGGMTDHDLPCVFDWEFYPERDPKKSDLPIGKAFLEEISQLSGRKPIIYLSASVPSEYGEPSWFADYTLWLAQYRAKATAPKPWASWTFWQNSAEASIPGLGNKGDSDFFFGGMEDLLNFIRASIK